MARWSRRRATWQRAPSSRISEGNNMNSNFHPAGSSALRIAAAAILLAGLCARASADDSFFSAPANPNTVRAGIYLVHYSASAPDLSGPYTPAGINLRVEHVNTPYLAYLRDFNNHWTFELAAGIPPTTHTYGVGPDKVGSVPFNGQEVATAKWFAPTFLLEYNFFDHAAAFRPFVGAGMNYTHFYDRKST